MNNTQLGKEFMRRAEELNLIPDEQSSSRKNKRYILTALNKVLVADISR